jgi:UDP-glucuronate decarboxylase
MHIPMRVLVTGGAGFIGHHLCRRLLSEGHQVTVLDDFSTGLESNLDGLAVEILRHDVRERFDVVCDQIYHLACPASPAFYQRDGIGTLRTAVQGTLNALELASRRKARILVASTSEVYGDPQVSPQPETYFGNVNTWGPRACYDEGKRAAEALCYEFQSQARADVRVARIFNTYGPGMRLDDGRVITEFITATLAGRPLRLDAGGEQTRAFCYVDDLADGLFMIMARSAVSGPVNIGAVEEVTIRQLSRMIAELAGSMSEVHEGPRREDDPMRRRPDLDKIKRLSGWEPKVCLEDGLRRTLAAFRKGLNQA